MSPQHAHGELNPEEAFRLEDTTKELANTLFKDR